ncbi:MAG: hypothetical protein COB36_08265 [Alphaproteobacteria bacterium]|nr:MAG: hypothetical protein COB36_08265 [Alphaproteobacteria bacterium]
MFDAADIYVFSSRMSCLALFLCRHGRKNIINYDRFGWAAQFVRHEEDGLITPIGDVAVMSASIARVISKFLVQ